MENSNPTRTILVLLLISLLSLSTGCASIVKGTTQAIPISSEPSGVDVLVDGNLVGSTPTTVELKRKTDHLITFQKENYETKAVAVVKSVGGAVWGNILAGRLIGWGVDAASGAQYNLDPKTIFVKMELVSNSNIISTSPDASEGIRKLNDLDLLHENNAISDEEFSLGRKALIEQYFPELIPAVTNEPES